VARKKTTTKDDKPSDDQNVDAEEHVEGTSPEPEPEPEPAEPKPKAKKAKKRADKLDGFGEFVGKAAKAWPGTTVIAADTPYKRLPRISTGNIGLDVATFGGWPRGRIIRVFGREKSAKTGSLLNTVAQWQKHCALCYERFNCHPDCEFSGDEENRPKAAALWIDVENRLESMWYWVEAHGIDLSRLLVQSPPDGQHVVDFVDAVIREKGAGIGLIVIDSIAQVTSTEEIEKPTVKGKTAPVNALLLNKAFRKWTAAVNALGVMETRKPTIILINQIRLTMDQYHPEALPGGEGQKYATSIDVRFASGKHHYLVENRDTGEVEDRVQTFGARWKPDEDAIPDYVEINYRVTASGCCPPGRYGQFNYWTRRAHGRRVGDPDNIERMWGYVKQLELMAKEGRNYTLFGLTGSSQQAIREQFVVSPQVQAKVWSEIVTKLINTE